MTFKLLSAYVALLFVLDWSLEVQSAHVANPVDFSHLHGAPLLDHSKPVDLSPKSRPFSENLVIHDATDSKIYQINQVGMQHLSAHPVPENFYDLVLPVIEGSGALYQREKHTQTMFNTFKSEVKMSGALEDHFAKELGWDGKYPVEDEPQITDERYVNNEDWVVFEEAKFPVALPPDAKHVHCFIRGPVTTPSCFDLRPGEIKPDGYDVWMENRDAYINFINGHDTFGAHVELTEDQQSRFATDLMETQVHDSLELQEALARGPAEQRIAASYRQAIDEYRSKLKSGPPREAKAALERAMAIDRPYFTRAKQAMAWATRNMGRLFEAKFPDQEFVWMSVNPWIRTQHLKLFDIFVKQDPAVSTRPLGDVARAAGSSETMAVP